MLLKDCILDFDVVVAAPFQRTAPEDVWTEARDSGAIPQVLYDLYRHADYLSFGSAPPFLRDSNNVLFSYFGLVLRSVMESLQDAEQQRKAFKESQSLTYDIGKKIRGETWERTADSRARRQFRDLLIALQTSLDSLADIVAIFWPGTIKNLSVGRAQFSVIETWLKRPFLTPSNIVVSPSEFYLQKLYDALSPIVNSLPPENDWLPLMCLLRNKAAHLGQPLFRQVGVHDDTGHFYVFIPREWPFIWEKDLKPAGTTPIKSAPTLLREGLIHQDIVSFSEGLQSKVVELVRSGISVVNLAFQQFKDLPFFQESLTQLQSNSVSYTFEHFLQP